MAAPKFSRRRIFGKLIPQAITDPSKVERYANAMMAGDEFPPIVAAEFDGEFIPIDGHHRLLAATAAGIPCDAWVCSGRAYDRFSCEVGSFEADIACLEACPQ